MLAKLVESCCTFQLHHSGWAIQRAGEGDVRPRRGVMIEAGSESVSGPSGSSQLSTCENQDPEVHTLGILAACAKLLYAHGETTQKVIAAVNLLAKAYGCQTNIVPDWEGIMIEVHSCTLVAHRHIRVRPTAVDMGTVAAAMQAAEEIEANNISLRGAGEMFNEVSLRRPISSGRFVFFASAGACALGVLFGDSSLIDLALIGATAGLGAVARRMISGGRNLFTQPFVAAIIAGVAGCVTVRLQAHCDSQLIAVCPCLVLIPGPHFLNGALDIAHGRLPLGVWRVTYAGLIVLSISAGLLIGLSIGGVALLTSAPSAPVSFLSDAAAAGVAVAAYGTFFSMPWKMLPFPIVVGLLAHSCRWLMINKAGGNAELAAFSACFLASCIISPLVGKLRLPFAAIAFSSVVSLIPGVYLFRLMAGVEQAVTLSSGSPSELAGVVLANAATALLLGLSIASGLIIPRLCFEYFESQRKDTRVKA